MQDYLLNYWQDTRAVLGIDVAVTLSGERRHFKVRAKNIRDRLSILGKHITITELFRKHGLPITRKRNDLARNLCYTHIKIGRNTYFKDTPELEEAFKKLFKMGSI